MNYRDWSKKCTESSDKYYDPSNIKPCFMSLPSNIKYGTGISNYTGDWQQRVGGLIPFAITVARFYQKPLIESVLLLNADISTEIGTQEVEFNGLRYTINEIFKQFTLEFIRTSLSKDIWVHESLYLYAYPELRV